MNNKISRELHVLEQFRRGVSTSPAVKIRVRPVQNKPKNLPLVASVVPLVEEKPKETLTGKKARIVEQVTGIKPDDVLSFKQWIESTPTWRDVLRACASNDLIGEIETFCRKNQFRIYPEGNFSLHQLFVHSATLKRLEKIMRERGCTDFRRDDLRFFLTNNSDWRTLFGDGKRAQGLIAELENITRIYNF